MCPRPKRDLPVLVLLLLPLLACTEHGGGFVMPRDDAGPPVAELAIRPMAATIAVDSSLALLAIPEDANGNRLFSRDVRWMSADTSVAMVSDHGVVTALRQGVDTITAESGGESARAIIQVAKDPILDSASSPSPRRAPMGYYVAVDGSSGGDGSQGRPWDLRTALAQPGAVGAGDTIWVRGGTYRGCFTSQLSGVVLRA
ncbi:MAG TPA: Ig-like domain-containing protein, partial [Gemmatimonadaceae bacterium]|nr:Ig-like domain-containing protein [Gemmatimonadaceae bacterium]